MNPETIRRRILAAVQPALDRADRAIRELSAPQPAGRHRAGVA